MSTMPPPPPPPPAFPPAPPPSFSGGGSIGGRDFAGFGARLGAYLIDGFVMTLIGVPFYIAGWFGLDKAVENCYSYETADGTTSIECPDGALQGGWLALGIALFAVGAVIGVVLYCKKMAKGQTWGHKATNIRVVDAKTGGNVSAGKAFGRLLLHAVSGWCCYLGFLWMLWDKDKQTWHDKMTGTHVVRA